MHVACTETHSKLLRQPLLAQASLLVPRPQLKCIKRSRADSHRPELHQVQSLFGKSAGSAYIDPQSPQQVYLRSTAATQRSLSFIAFCTQLALSISSAGILLFSLSVSPPVTPDRAATLFASRILAFVGVATSFISTSFAHGFQRLAAKLTVGDVVEPSWLANNLLWNNKLSLAGISATVIGLQVSVGTLVGKSLLTSFSSPYGPASASGNALVSLDVFALQASTNTLLAHVIALVFTTWMLRLVNVKAPTTTVINPA